MSATLDRVRKLLALADNEAASPNEADNARRLAERLMAAAGLTESDIRNGTDEDPAATVGVTSVRAPEAAWYGVLAVAVARVTGCAVWRDVGPWGQVRRWAGTEDQRAAAVELHAWLIRQVNRLADGAKRSPEYLATRHRRAWLTDYRQGVATAVARLAMQMVESRPKSTDSAALARVDAVQAAIDKLKPETLRKARNVYTRASAAYAMGQAAGSSIALRRSVGVGKSRMLGAGGGS